MPDIIRIDVIFLGMEFSSFFISCRMPESPQPVSNKYLLRLRFWLAPLVV